MGQVLGNGVIGNESGNATTRQVTAATAYIRRGAKDYFRFADQLRT